MNTLTQATYRVVVVAPTASTDVAVRLRRALFDSVGGAALRRMGIEGVPHEFSIVPGVREDALDIAMNLGDVRFTLAGSGPARFELDVRGPQRVTARDLRVPPGLATLDTDRPIATVGAGGRLRLWGEVGLGRGFEPADRDTPPGTIALDRRFGPVKRALCTAEGDSLVVSLATDGRATPRQALDDAIAALGLRVRAIEELAAVSLALAPAGPAVRYERYRGLPPPELTGMHRRAFRHFVESVLPERVAAPFPVRAADGSGELVLTGLEVRPPESTAVEALDVGGTHAGSLHITLDVTDAQGRHVAGGQVCLGSVPWLTDRETFVVGGVERVAWPVIEVAPDQEDARVAERPIRSLRPFTDALATCLADVTGVLGELLARHGVAAFDLSLVAESLPVGRALTDSLSAHLCAHALDDTNPLARLTDVRRISAMGPGNLDDSAGPAIRSLQPGHYGRLCYLETPEGVRIGLIHSLALFGELGEDGLLRATYARAGDSPDAATVTLTAAEEGTVPIAEADARLTDPNAPTRVRRGGEFLTIPAREVRYREVSSLQPFGASVALIPFACHSDSNRLLMGANMQRQAVPLLRSEAPRVGSGLEEAIASAGGAVLRARRAGRVVACVGDTIRVAAADGGTDEYRLRKFRPTNAGTWLNQRALASEGQDVQTGQPIAEECGCEGGELALGANVLAAFLPWEGLNFEDGIVVNERLIRDDRLTSLHLVRVSMQAHAASGESFARPMAGDARMDERGVARIGTAVADGHALAWRVRRTPDGTVEEPLRAPRNADGGRVSRVRCRSAVAGDALPPGVSETVEIEIAVKRKAEIGDKLSNRHGAKGVIAAIVPEADMPYLPDGTPIEMLLNPLGVPSRMNVGQVLELHMGWAALASGRRRIVPAVKGATASDIADALAQAGLPRSGMTTAYDGRDGRPFDRPISVGSLYMFRLNHLAVDKLRVRAGGPVSLLTRQPVADVTHDAGQYFGETEAWAAAAHGAYAVLREILGDAGGAGDLIALLRGLALDVVATDTRSGESGWRIALATPATIHGWSSGEVVNAALTEGDAPASGGLFCPGIFGPVAVPSVTGDATRLETIPAPEGWAPSERMGHIELAVPVVHPWIPREVSGTANTMPGIEPQATILKVLPVVAPSLRPMVRTPSGEWRADALNALYGRVIARNQACRRALEQSAPEALIRQLGRGLQEAVDQLFGGGSALAAGRSLGERLAGRGGGLLSVGRRGDYSCRAAIAPGVDLKLGQCGLPVEVAREWFRTSLVGRLLREGVAGDEADAQARVRRGEADGWLAEALRGRVVLLNRAPTMDRYHLQAFEPVLTPARALLLHPLACRPFNADFDGDQMVAYLPVSEAAQEEARRTMTPLSLLAMSRPNEPVVLLTQEIVLGLNDLTRTEEGRSLLNSTLPPGTPPIRDAVDRKALQSLVQSVLAERGPRVTADLLDSLRRLGFRHATRSGATIGMDWLKVYSRKSDLLARLRAREQVLADSRRAGTLSEEAAADAWCQAWFDATAEIGKGALEEMAADSGGNPVYRMYACGARASAPQLRQLNGIRGLFLSGPRSDEKLVPVAASFIEGLSPWEGFVSGYGSRRGLMDAALKVAEASRLHRRLVSRLMDVRIVQEDCGTPESIVLDPLSDGGSTIEDAAERATGRVAAEDVTDPATGERLVKCGEIVGASEAARIRAARLTGLKVRSVLGCRAEGGVCARCYGADAATGEPVAVGSAVGLIGAQAIGEPLSQLTLQSFYGWKRSSMREVHRGGLPRLADLEREGAGLPPEELVRRLVALFREQWVAVPDKHFELLARVLRNRTRHGWLARAASPDAGQSAAGVLIRAAACGESDPLTGLLPRLLTGRW